MKEFVVELQIMEILSGKCISRNKKQHSSKTPTASIKLTKYEKEQQSVRFFM
jgi:hypothetical protein